MNRALSGINPAANYVEAPECSAALAAAEVVAAAYGKPSKALPAGARTWIRRVRPAVNADVLKMARTAVGFCRDGKNSELRQLWAESKDYQEWLADTASLLSRLK
jgi:hypothetical protein